MAADGRVAAPGLVLSLTFVATGEGETLLAGLHRQGVARSDDGGAHWQRGNIGLNARLLNGLVLSPAFARDQTLYAFGPQDGVSVSTDGGTDLGGTERRASGRGPGAGCLGHDPVRGHPGWRSRDRDRAVTWTLAWEPLSPRGPWRPCPARRPLWPPWQKADCARRMTLG